MVYSEQMLTFLCVFLAGVEARQIGPLRDSTLDLLTIPFFHQHQENTVAELRMNHERAREDGPRLRTMETSI